MFHKKQKVLCYVLIFDQFDIIKKSLDFLTNYADRLDIVVIENPSPQSASIKRYVSDLGVRRLIKRHYIMDENIAANATRIVIDKERELVAATKYVLVTDGDIVSDNHSWLDEELSIMRRHKDIYACGITLDLSNLPLKTFPNARDWIPNDITMKRDYAEVATGGHLLMQRGAELLGLIDWTKKTGSSYVDHLARDYCYNVLGKKWVRTKVATAYHLTWDLYADPNHPYTKLKTAKTFDEIWHRNQVSNYRVVDYD